MTREQRADKVLSNFEQTCLGGILVERYDDSNEVLGVTVGKMRRFIEEQLRETEDAMKERCAKLAEDNDCDSLAEKIRLYA